MNLKPPFLLLITLLLALLLVGCNEHNYCRPAAGASHQWGEWTNSYVAAGFPVTVDRYCKKCNYQQRVHP